MPAEPQKRKARQSRAFPKSTEVEVLLDFLGRLEHRLVAAEAVDSDRRAGGETTARSPSDTSGTVEVRTRGARREQSRTNQARSRGRLVAGSRGEGDRLGRTSR